MNKGELEMICTAIKLMQNRLKEQVKDKLFEEYDKKVLKELESDNYGLADGLKWGEDYIFDVKKEGSRLKVEIIKLREE